MKKFILYILAFLPFLLACQELPFVIVIASYNNAIWVENNLNSALAQDYSNYRIIYINDCSTDGTGEKVDSIAQSYNVSKEKLHIIHNKTRLGALENQYNAVHSCLDKEIIVILDGDDWFPDHNVLSYLNQVYNSGDIWLTYGQFIEFPSGQIGFCCPMPERVVRANKFREFVHIPSHVRTFYAWLFKQIKKEDLMHEGKFLPMTGDIGAMFPMIEMAREGHFRFINRVLYVYNAYNPINDHKVSKESQRFYDLLIRNKPPYQAVTKKPIA